MEDLIATAKSIKHKDIFSKKVKVLNNVKKIKATTGFFDLLYLIVFGFCWLTWICFKL